MPLTDNELARREAGEVLIRREPVRLHWQLDELVSLDGHRVSCLFAARVRALDSAGQQRMLAEALLGARAAVTVQHVEAHFRAALEAAARNYLSATNAGQAMTETCKTALATLLRKAADAVAFTCGLEMLPPLEIELHSPTMERLRVEDMQRALAERRFEGQLQHFERAAELLRQFEQLRAAAPSLSAGQVLRQTSPSDQGPLLQMLLLARGRQARPARLQAVAGPVLFRIDATLSADGASRNVETTRVNVPDTLGPLRSVQPARIDGAVRLLVGARSGVMVVDPGSPALAECYLHRTESQLGFSRAIVLGSRIWACHSDAGLVAWEVGRCDAPMIALRPADLDLPPEASIAPSTAMTSSSMSTRSGPPGVRNLQALDGDRVIFSAGSALMFADESGKTTLLASEHRHEIVALTPIGSRLVVAYEDGLVATRELASLAPAGQTRPGGRLAAAASMPWLGESRLLLASSDGPVLSVGLDDPLTMQYQSAHRGMRALAATEDLVVGISPDRQRLVLWNAWNPQSPAAEIPLAAIARHRIADVDVDQ